VLQSLTTRREDDKR